MIADVQLSSAQHAKRDRNAHQPASLLPAPRAHLQLLDGAGVQAPAAVARPAQEIHSAPLRHGQYLHARAYSIKVHEYFVFSRLVTSHFVLFVTFTVAEGELLQAPDGQ